MLGICGWKIMTSDVMSNSQALCWENCACWWRPNRKAPTTFYPDKAAKTRILYFSIHHHRDCAMPTAHSVTPPLRIILLSLCRQRHKVVTLVHTSTIPTRVVCSVLVPAFPTQPKCGTAWSGEEKTKKKMTKSIRFDFLFHSRNMQIT